MKIVNCQVNHLKNPMGFSMGTPTFSYVIEEAKGKKQTKARICVCEEKSGKEAADTGFREDLDSLAISLPMELKPRTAYLWTVSACTDAGEEATSEPNRFETGKMDEPWQAKWISCDRNEPRHPIFEKKFNLSEGIESARLYISGLGLYHALINGKEVTNEKLTPFSFDYRAWVQVQTYDVTGLLAGDNTIDVELGNGWYKGRFGFTTREGAGGFYGDDWKLIAELRVRFADGSEQIICTDESWDVYRGKITFSNIYDGEHRDDTLQTVYGGKAVPAEKIPHLEDRLSIPLIPHEELKPVELIKTPAGEQVFDLGQNMAGIFRLHVKAPAGTVVHVQVGEVLQEGNFYRDNLRTALAEYYYTSDGTEKDIEPRFTYYGYRYAKVEGLSELSIDDFTGIALYSDVTPVGMLTTGIEKINKLLSNIAWGQKGNFLDVPTDCPQRDERMGWTADTQVFVPTASYLTDSYAFYHKYLYDMRKEQVQVDGMIPNVIPSAGMSPDCSSVWADAATFIPWFNYLYYGDKAALSDNFELMKDWVDWIRRYDGENRAWGSHFHFGDWLALDNPTGAVDAVMGGTEEAFIAYVYYLQSARIVEKAARILGKTEEETYHRELADSIEKYLMDEYYTPNGRCAVNTQTANVLTIWFDLQENPQKALTQLLKLLKVKNNKLQTGFVGTPMLNRALSKMGEDKLAYSILESETYPGWLYEINLGATTVWERWNSMEADGKVSSTGMNSFNHYAYGSIGEWMWQTIAGINPCEEKPGFRRAFLRPVPDYAMKHAQACYHSPAGTYRTSWEVLSMNEVTVKAEVPFGCTARLELVYAPEEDRFKELEPGVYEFTYKTVEPLRKVYSVDTPLEELLSDENAKQELVSRLHELSMIPGNMHRMSLRQIYTRFIADKEEAEKRIGEVSELLSSL